MGTLELVSTIAGSVFGSQVLGTLINNFFNRKKMAADVDSTSTDNALKLVDVLKQRVDKLELMVDEMRKENLELHKEVVALRTELSFYKQGKV